jgi:hypothetical protein
MSRRLVTLGLITIVAGCGAMDGGPGHSGGADMAGGGGSGGIGGSGGVGGSGGTGGSGGGTGNCSTDPNACYTVYAHSNTTLYSIDLMAKTLVTIGPFNAPGNDVMTDLAVAPDNTIYTVSKTNLYTASPTDGHVTLVGSINTCGLDNVALSTTADGKLYVGDYQGAFCEIDITKSPPGVTKLGTLGGTMALSGDLVGVGDGTLYGTAYDTKVSATDTNNVLVTLDPKTGAVLNKIGPTGFPKLFGISYALGQVFGFTHDGSGRVITIDPKTGKGTLFNTFTDPTTQKPISFAGAGVNSKVDPII